MIVFMRNSVGTNPKKPKQADYNGVWVCGRSSAEQGASFRINMAVTAPPNLSALISVSLLSQQP